MRTERDALGLPNPHFFLGERSLPQTVRRDGTTAKQSLVSLVEHWIPLVAVWVFTSGKKVWWMSLRSPDLVRE